MLVSSLFRQSLMPLSQPSERRTGPLNTATPRILIADDDVNLTMMMREVLRSAGFEVLIVHDGVALVRMAQEYVPDLLLIDLILPQLDGFEAMRQLRNDTRTAHLPMLIITAHDNQQEMVGAFDNGADDYIVKPYDMDVLIARIRGHLRRAAQLPVHSPLTGLPGNRLLRAEVQHLLAQGAAFTLLYIDIDEFKAFNDCYGFAQGDQAIRLLARVLVEVGQPGDFLGHIGGDDFAIVHRGADVGRFCQRIITAFELHVPHLYDADDRGRGYLETLDRHGVQRRFGLMSLSIAGVVARPARFASFEAIGQAAATLKASAKRIPGSSVIIDELCPNTPTFSC